MKLNQARIAEKRRAKGITQEEVARIAGVTCSCIVSIENGHRKPQAETLANIAHALNTKMGYFFDLD